MITIKYCDSYCLKPDEILLTKFTSDIFEYTKFNKGKTLVIFANELGITKKILEPMLKSINTNLKIIIYDNSLFGFKSKSVKYEGNETKESVSPFDLAIILLNSNSRDKLLTYLLDDKPSLVVPLKAIISNYHKLGKKNREVLSLIGKHLWKVDPEIISCIAATRFSSESLKFLKWNYPKKTMDKEDKNAS